LNRTKSNFINYPYKHSKLFCLTKNNRKRTIKQMKNNNLYDRMYRRFKNNRRKFIYLLLFDENVI